MKTPRLRIVLPVAVVLTIFAPLMRQLPGGAGLPDLWLLMLLLAVPVPAPDSWRRPIQLVFVLGLLRCSVSVVSPFVAWAGLGAALFVRESLSRRLNEYRFILRFLTGFCAAIPLMVLDRLVAERLGTPIAPTDAWLRCLWVGILVALFTRPQLKRRAFSRGNS
jgi:hypothetical protein